MKSFFSLWTKIWPILCHFWQHKSVFLQILHQSLVPSNITSLHFLKHILWSKTAHKSANCLDFRKLGYKFVKRMSILNWQVNSYSIFASFFIVMTHNSHVHFKLMHFQLWAKEYHQSPNFETFKCSGENLPNSSCHFWKRKSVFLQIFYQSWMQPNLPPLYFICWSNIYFGQKHPITVQISEIYKCLDQNFLNC